MKAAPLTASEPVLGDALASGAYLRARQQPRRREGDYLILQDIRALVEQRAATWTGDIFDFGCGGAPYLPFFAGCRTYVKADVTAGPLVDRLIEPDGRTGESDSSYDAVFSSQVLEHVADPGAYLRECLRILRPGGELLLTTHGLFPEHRCPDDFHRWTSDGLLREAQLAGFEILEAGKLTVGVRGAVQMLHHCVWSLRTGSDRRLFGLVLGVLRKLHGWLAVPVLNWFADRFPEQGRVASGSAEALYIGVYVRGRKPAEGP